MRPLRLVCLLTPHASLTRWLVLDAEIEAQQLIDRNSARQADRPAKTVLGRISLFDEISRVFCAARTLSQDLDGRFERPGRSLLSRIGACQSSMRPVSSAMLSFS